MDAFAVLAWISRLQPETHASGSGSSILCPHSPPDIPLLLMDHGCMARFFFRAPRVEHIKNLGRGTSRHAADDTHTRNRSIFAAGGDTPICRIHIFGGRVFL